MSDYIEVFCDNGGGAQLQVVIDGYAYAHFYDADMDQLANDIRDLAAGTTPLTDWDGNESTDDPDTDIWQDYDAEIEANGGYRHYLADNAPCLISTIIADADTGWSQISELQIALTAATLDK